ncbi:E3 ubiquitin-protein ligase ATL41-like [Triticum dicoccoides]|uniref:E3 ubiquitin-protein ligase ATL41-like n=1 Tax=Triticum dicoccoides TaxID=85692 RepID=UPI000E7948BB|nr:E3 ubiquitin-protein ligase ATL41-like [Triticum dicoccoides]
MSGDRFTGAPASNGPPAPYPRQQNYSFNGRVLLMAAFLLFGLTVFFTLIRFLLYVLVARSGGRRRRGSFTAGILRSINSFGGTSGRRGLDASALSALPVTTYRKEGAATAGADCAVCLSELADGEKVRELPNCGHSFHVECVDAWLRSRTTCPLCRAEAELPKGNDKAEVAAQSSSSSSSSSAREPPQQALFGAGGTLIVTVQGGFPDTQRGVRGSTSG